jgi:hypothetical protein
MLSPDRKKISNPTNEQIEKALTSLPPHKNSWITLSFGITEYIVASGSKEEGFIFELERFSRDFHNRIKDNPLNINDTVQIFKSYSKKDLSWAEECEWERVYLNDIYQ